MKKGTLLEESVYNVLLEMTANEKLAFKSTQCKVFLHKKYFSKDRDNFIKTDVSIEVFIENANEPFFIWIWECKDYKNAIPIDDLEEFHAKLEQIGADNTKGTMITAQGYFQTGAINYAKNKKIGLARLLPDEQVEFILCRMTPDMIEKYNNCLSALSQEYYNSVMQDTFILDNVHKYSSLQNYILKTINELK